ncbi:MAG: branched-chain amino acid transport system II carrier protein [Suipraeoptans sp.]
MNTKLSFKEYFFVGSMLFGMFFGAGNLIFPIHMGQEAGSLMLPATIGFIITATGLPFLGVLAIGISEKSGLLGLSSSVGKKWGYFFTTLLYLTIGPFFAFPRTGTVSYEIGLSLYVPEEYNRLGLLIFTIIFFTIALFFSLKPGKLVIWIGKVLNPVFLILLGVLIAAAFLNPMGSISNAQVAKGYVNNTFSTGFIEGYNTMDALASLAFGVLVVKSLKDMGVKEPGEIAKNTAKAGAVSAALMVIIYACLSYIGATSLGKLELSANGGIALAQIADYYFGHFGRILLAILVTVACLKTAIGLTTSCAEAFVSMFPKTFSYKTYVVIFTVIGGIIANVGLTQIISLSLPVLMFLYPLAIVLILFTLLFKKLKNSKIILVTTISITTVFSIGDALKSAPHNFQELNIFSGLIDIYNKVPLARMGMGWVIPSIIGLLIGFMIWIIQVRCATIRTDKKENG